jgi:hypothetical protein
MSFLLLGDSQTIALHTTLPIRTIVAVEIVFKTSLTAKCLQSCNGELGSSQSNPNTSSV